MKFIQSNNNLLIGILIGILISSFISQGFNQVIELFDIAQYLIYFLSLLYFLSFSILEFFIFNNSDVTPLQILGIKTDKNLRSLKIIMVNNNLLEGEDLFKAIYTTLMNNKSFLNFGFQKIIILSVVLLSESEHNLHSNILISNDTTFKEYYSTISHELANYNNLQYGYHNEAISRYVVLAWNVDNAKNLLIKQTYSTNKLTKSPLGLSRSYSTLSTRKWYKGLINPISLYNKKGILKQQSIKPIFTMDLETVYLDSVKSEVVIAISSCGVNNSKLESKLFVIDHLLLKSDKVLAVKNLWKQYFNYLENLELNQSIDKLTIFAHNLGDFDGYFLYKGLMNHYNPEHISSIIDEYSSFISIKLLSGINTGLSFEWKDSLRIFPMSLDKLCKLFGVEGKLIPYNSKFNSISLFDSPRIWGLFKKYALQDAVALYEALFNAQLLYFNDFKVDIESIYSTATLALKIFRTKFLDKDIFILPQHTDFFIRTAYFGGGTDVYKAFGELIHYYDVNSLYPNAMLNPMPHDLVNPNLINFFICF